MARQGAVAQGRYRMSREGQASQRGLQGMYILQENAGCQIYRPTWQGTRTVFRPFPGRNPENPTEWDPFRLTDEDRDFGDWIRRYDMASGFGVPGITFIIKDPMDKDSDTQQNPVWMLQRAITQAVKSGQGQPSWNPLIFGATGRAAPLNAPKDGYVMQGILMEHKSSPQNPPRGVLPEHQPVVLLMSQSAGGALMTTLSEKNADGGWLYPDITALDAGRFIQFHQAGTQTQYQQGAATKQMTEAPAVGGGVTANSYECEIRDLYNGISPTFDAIHALADAHAKPWDEIIRVPTTEEQVRMLCNAGIAASAIVYALSDVYGEFIPQHIFDQARAQQPQTSVAVGQPEAAQGASPMGQPATSPAQQEQAVAQQGAEPAQAGAPMTTGGQATSPPQGQPMTGGAAPQAEQAATEYDPQPTHADAERSQATMDALQRARTRAAK